MKRTLNPKNILLLFLVAFVILAFFLIQPFIRPIITAIVLAYIFYPLYQKLNKKVKNSTIAAIIMAVLIILIITIPLIFILNTVTKEAYVGYLIAKQRLVGVKSLSEKCKEGFACSIVNYYNKLTSNPEVMYHINSFLESAKSSVIKITSGFIVSLPKKILDAFIMIFVLFYLLKDGSSLIEKTKYFMILKNHHKEKLFKKVNDVTYAVVYGHIITALIQGFVGGIGFYIFGITNPILWGVIMSLAALIPYVGTPVIWVPASLLQILSGYLANDITLVGKGIGLFLYGALLVSSIDNILKPKIIGKRANVHPAWIFLGVIGGLKMFGFIGIVVGPLILVLTITLLKIYREEV